MSEAEASACQIKRTCGCATHSVREEIISACEKEPPLLAWAEPQADWYGHGTGRHPQFIPLQQLQGTMPDWPKDLPLTEARLFWKNRVRHIVANEHDGCRWVDIEELTKEAGKQDDPATTTRVSYEMLAVYTLRDLERFGLNNSDVPLSEKLNAITYRQQGRLIAWRLTQKENPHA